MPERNNHLLRSAYKPVGWSEKMADFPSPNSDQRGLSPTPAMQESIEDETEGLSPDTRLADGHADSEDRGTKGSSAEENAALFPSHQCETLENEWRTIQTNFIDSPRDAVQKADALVNKTIETLASSFGDMRASLEQTWEKDGHVSTEELRLAMQNYRSFFRRLLSI
jgi:hypothetical protein